MIIHWRVDIGRHHKKSKKTYDWKRAYLLPIP